uniref:ATP synthase F0 subunit 8 n=1 Tax=Metrocoris tigrinus TaxID=3095938 RepID=A0AB38Z6G9_9HEMI|nr:ATP synthase F0 subunit 8 [Metrocoris tigrinus]WPW46960.1 ATP synthase F0 subunit 8 [Metrocoris tigrinus]
MPQMAPLSWITLMIMFTMTMMMINTIVYFYKNYQTKKNDKDIYFNKMNWMW